MTLYLRESGPANAPTITLLHGGGTSGWMWNPQVQNLSEDYHCLVPDLPENGHSIDGSPFSIKGCAEMIADLIRGKAHGGRAHVIGLSLGAQTILQLLAIAPELVDHAIISGTLVRPISGVGMVNLIYKLYAPFRNMDFLVRANMKAIGIPREYFEEVKEDTRLLTAEALARITAENARFRLPPGLECVTVPTLVLIGEKERKVLHESAHDIVATIPTSRAYIAPGVGHVWNLQAPNLFIAAVRAWLGDEPVPSELVPLR